MTARSLLCDIKDSRDLLDITDSRLMDDATEKADAKDPIEPMDRNEPTLPTDSVDPTEPMERNESFDAIDHLPRRDGSTTASFRAGLRCAGHLDGRPLLARYSAPVVGLRPAGAR